MLASPTFKATYTGVLKLFLDKVPTDGLAGVAAVPVMMGADPATPSPPNCCSSRSSSSWAPPAHQGPVPARDRLADGAAIDAWAERAALAAVMVGAAG